MDETPVTPEELLLEVIGQWTGQWWPHSPGMSPHEAAEQQCKEINCEVTCVEGVWKAIFHAQCDQYYTFPLTMQGRPSGSVVLFLGTADLGQLGGLFDWIGRASAEEFVGFFTSSHYVGEFRMEKK